jgi:hypothetical protein
MQTVSPTAVLDIAFAAAVVVAALALAGAALRFLPKLALLVLTVLASGGAVAAWTFFALRRPHHWHELAVAAGGVTVGALATAASLTLRRAVARADAIEAHLADAQARLTEQIDREAADRAEELERTLARARADSISLLVEEERRIAEERRREFAEREHEVGGTLAESLTSTQGQIEQRLAAWTQDLDRVTETTKSRIAELTEHQKRWLADVEVRLAADAAGVAAESDDQRGTLARMRAELEKAIEAALATARSEVDANAAERRRALHELDERMRRREKELMERIEREEIEAAARIRAGFEDVGRKQIEQMARIVERAAGTYSDDAAQQFAALVKSGREDAARRLSRELDRSVEVFAREAEAVLAERLAHVGDAGAQRLERRLTEAAHALERQRDEWMAALDGRIADLETDVRRRLEELGADAEAERAVLEARLQELVRRFEATGALQGHS